MSVRNLRDCDCELTSYDSRIWDSTTGQCLKTLVHEDNAPVTSVRFSPNGKFVLATTLDSAVRLWNYVEGRVVKTYQGHKNQKYSINACFGTYKALVAKRAEEDEAAQTWAFVACGDEEGRTVIWDVSSKEVLQILPNHQGPVLGVDASPSGEAIATGGLDGTIKVWWRAKPKEKERRPKPSKMDRMMSRGDDSSEEGHV